jgi:hypothetical protein
MISIPIRYALFLFVFIIWPGAGYANCQPLFQPPETAPQVLLPAAHPLRVARQAAVAVNFEALQEGRAGQVQLNLFNDALYVAEHSNTEFRSDQGYAWYGHLQGIAGSWVVLVIDRDRISGVIRLPLLTYKIWPLADGLHVVREIYPDDRGRPTVSGIMVEVSGVLAGEEESEVLLLVNQERAEAGLHALAWNDQLANAARSHSLDMATQNYFSHTGLDGSSPGERITAAGYTWQTYGENIAYGYATPAAVMTGWMNSDGHRANILGKSFCELGVGLAEHANSGFQIYWTQDFGKQQGAADCTDTPSNQMPVARFLAQPLSGAAPLGVALDASDSYDPDGQIEGYQWDFGDGSSGNGVIVQHDYLAAGTYTVSLTVVDDNGDIAMQRVVDQIEVSDAGDSAPGDVPDDDGGAGSANDGDSGGGGGCFISLL